MGIFILIILFILWTVVGASDPASSGPSSRKKEHTARRTQRRHDSYDESDSWFDRHGNEHLLDEDRYCEDCDEHHEE